MTPDQLSNISINGVPMTWRQMYESERDERYRADRYRSLLYDLTRCEHGRHAGDSCSQCGGISVGNTYAPIGSRIGTRMNGTPIIAPPSEGSGCYDS